MSLITLYAGTVLTTCFTKPKYTSSNLNDHSLSWNKKIRGKPLFQTYITQFFLLLWPNCSSHHSDHRVPEVWYIRYSHAWQKTQNMIYLCDLYCEWKYNTRSLWSTKFVLDRAIFNIVKAFVYVFFNKFLPYYFHIFSGIIIWWPYYVYQRIKSMQQPTDSENSRTFII